ncbi:MAG: recombinase family protein [Candidatus Omnitrophica bacterium]|nr:recombinase family protein [Candidatus Omnitrophota bacterium]
MNRYFIYARKSTDEEDRQILSLDSQLNELREFAQKEGLSIVEEFMEAKTAKQPGRRFFNYMLKRIEVGDADGILAWHPDRLARNSIDGGKIIYLVDQGVLKDLRFPTYRFDNTAQGKFVLNIAFGQSKYYIDNLSENVKRGIREKLRRGEWPGWAPLGYINDYKNRTIILDDDKSILVKKMFEVFAKGDISVAELHRQVTKLGLLSRTGKPVSHEVVSQTLRNPFYYGMIRYKGELYEGSHPPLISKKLFDTLQEILLGHRHPQVRGRIKFEYTGLMRCGECGRMITAEYQRGYIYYRCTKKNTSCTQKFLREEALLSQLIDALKKVYIDDSVKEKIFKRFDYYASRESKASFSLSGQISQKIKEIDAKIERLIDLYISQDISDEEYQNLKAKLLNEKHALKEKFDQIEKSSGGWLEHAKEFVTTCNRIGSVAWQENPRPSRDFLKTVGSNFILKDRSLLFSYSKPFDLIAKSQGDLDWCA